MNRRNRGYSLTELLVSVAVLGITLAGLYDVLRQGLQSVAGTRSAETTPQFDTAWLQVRRDVQAALSAPSGAEAWAEAPLDLKLPEDRRIRLALRDGALVREEWVGERNGALRPRVLARPVRVFRWRRPADGLVEVELTPAREYDPDTAPVVRPRTSTVLCAMRGGGRSAGGW